MKKTKMLKKNYEFSNVFTKGKYFSGKKIGAFILNNPKNENYLGIAISVKAGHAYQRNRIKRLIRENYRVHENEINSGASIVFILKKNVNIEEIDFNMVNQDIKEILEKAKLIG